MFSNAKKIILIICIFIPSLSFSQVFNLDAKWNLLGATEDIPNLDVFKSTCAKTIIIYQKTKTWKTYPKDSDFTSLSLGQGFWLYNNKKGTCNIDTKSSVNDGGVLDITDMILTNKSANCSDYVKKYGSSVLDIKNNENFKGVFEVYLEGDKCIFKTNEIPNHNFNDESARFATKISVQNTQLSITQNPSFATQVTELQLGENGMMLNGVRLDILPAGCYGVGDGKIGCHDIDAPWRYDPMSPKASFGTDKHNAHTQPSGAYHYHANPNALFEDDSKESPVIGFAIDGFPIFGKYFKKYGETIKATSSYKLKSGQRQAVNGINPNGDYDGTFRDDYEYISSSGNLDECNGATIDGVYGYYVTDTFPWIINCYKGNVEIKKRPPPKNGEGRPKGKR